MQQSLKLPFLYLSKATFIVATGDSFPAENAEPIAKNKIRIKSLQLRSYSSWSVQEQRFISDLTAYRIIQ